MNPNEMTLKLSTFSEYLDVCLNREHLCVRTSTSDLQNCKKSFPKYKQYRGVCYLSLLSLFILLYKNTSGYKLMD